ncbi:OprD family outer membrane porin [Sulfuricurvum sp.]|uniref:OprD family outer membrane porin n=1 Tax=Sulfuricurvum sp. TaxID=2025608 RepID=UPI00356B3A58
MRHTVRLSLLASLLVMNASAADDLESMFKEGKVSGQIREFSISRDVEDTRPVSGVVGKDYTRKANVIGGYLKYDTAAWNGLSLGAAFYTTNGLLLQDTKMDYYRVDPTLLGNNNGSYSQLGEAYVQYKYGNTTFKGGRQKLDTPMAGSDDARMLPNLFEAYVVSNTDLKDTTFIAAQVTKFAQGTFGRAYNGGVLGVTSGYSLNNIRDTDTGQFVDMGSYAIGQNTGGVSVAAAIYSGIPGLKLQLWDYYARNILNAIYGEASYGFTMANGIAPYVAAQYIGERDVGSNSVITKVKSDFSAAKAGVKVANFDVYGAISHNSKDATAAVNGGTISPWGGMPAYTQGMVTRHQFMAGTDAWKLAGSYDWKNFGVNLNTGIYYTSFKMDALNGYSTNYAWTAQESGVDVIYSPEKVKNLQLRLRANYTDDFYQSTTGAISWSEYRFIVNYNF